MSRARRLPRHRPVPMLAWLALPAAAVAVAGLVAAGGSGSEHEDPAAAPPGVRLVQPAGSPGDPAGAATGIATATTAPGPDPRGTAGSLPGTVAGHASTAPSTVATARTPAAVATTAAEHGRPSAHPTHPAHPSHP